MPNEFSPKNPQQESQQDLQRDKDAFDQGLEAIHRLNALLMEETRLIAAGDIDGGLRLAAEKARYAASMSEAVQTLRLLAREGNRSNGFEDLRQKIEAMQETLAVNLAVLATARSVAENILRDVARRLAPGPAHGYGPGSSHRSAAPIILSRAT